MVLYRLLSLSSQYFMMVAVCYMEFCMGGGLK